MPAKLSICQVSAAYYPYPSGLTEHVHYLAGALRRRGHDVEILTTSFGGPKTEEPGVARFGRAWLVPLNKSFCTVPMGLGMSGQVKRFLAERRFDVVHVHGAFPPDISYWATRHSRGVTLVTFHTVGFRLPRLGARIARAVMSGSNRRLAGRIAESRAALEFQQAFFPGEYRIIPAGVDIERFRPGIPPIPGLGPDGRTILFLGRLDERKGLRVLIEAMPRVRSSVSGARLIVVGRGPLLEACRRLAGQLGVGDAVEFRGFVTAPDVARCYASADVFCSPALGGEAYGIVLLEAMATGVPVVASDIPGYNEVVAAGESGVLFPAGDSRALADVLAGLLSDSPRRRRIAEAGRRSAAAVSWDRVAERVEDYYRAALTRRIRA